MSKLKLLFILINIFTTVILASCDVEDCTSTKSNRMIVEFYRQSSGNEYQVFIDSLFSPRNDSVIRDTVQQVMLFLDPTADSTTFELQYIPYEVDSIFLDPPVNEEFDRTDTTYFEPRTETYTFTYTRTQRIISVDCGVEQAFNNLKVANSTTEVEIVNKNIDRFNDLNAKINLF